MLHAGFTQLREARYKSISQASRLLKIRIQRVCDEMNLAEKGLSL